MLATFLDVMLPTSAAYQGGGETGLMPTVSLSLDYLEPTPAGAWVELRTDLLRMGRRLCFAQGVATANGRPCVRANGVFSVPASSPPGTRTLVQMLKQLLLQTPD